LRVSLEQLRQHAVSHALSPPTDLARALRRMGFVQADPIRAPAVAQDLILRHRVRRYRVGDLDRGYESLEIEEDYVYAYGFVAREVGRLLHPRKARALGAFEKRVLAVVRELGNAHPRDLEPHFGTRRVVNAWGGVSKATTRALDVLHHRGFLRVLRRTGGTRVYGPSVASEPLPPERRLRALVSLMARLLAPVPVRTLRANIARFKHLGRSSDMIMTLVGDGALEQHVVDGVAYVSPEIAIGEPQRAVRLLAPFDPLVWDRYRFERLWGWRYRFEAYTPPKDRVRGYYAMPLLWCDRVVGWANVSVQDDALHVETGFHEKPKEVDFRRALDEELDRLKAFLGLP
jgi:uncharacterized protein YcaQ